MLMITVLFTSVAFYHSLMMVVDDEFCPALFRFFCLSFDDVMNNKMLNQYFQIKR